MRRVILEKKFKPMLKKNLKIPLGFLHKIQTWPWKEKFVDSWGDFFFFNAERTIMFKYPYTLVDLSKMFASV